MPARFTLVFLVFLFLQPSLSAADLKRGEALHNEHCLRCHSVNIYSRNDRMVNNMSQLSERVKQCELANDLLWFEEDVDDVSAYLNADFYLFGVK